VSEVRERVALRGSTLVGNFLVASSERNRLEREEIDLPRVIEGELDNSSDLLVVDAVDDGRDRDDVDAGGVKVLDRAQLDVEEVADQAMGVGGVADAIELEVRVAQTCFCCRTGELRALCELDPVGRRLVTAVANFLLSRRLIIVVVRFISAQM